MRTIRNILIVLVSLVLLVSCGRGDKDKAVTISGRVSITSPGERISGPTLIAIARTDSVEAIEHDPENSIVTIAGIDESSMTYDLDLTDYGLKSGDEIYIIGFVDNGYINGIPYPKKGDFIGFYFNPSSLKTGYALKEGANQNLDLTIGREVFSYSASVSGTIGGTDAGDVLLIAYAGVIESSDMSGLDPNAVIGYTRLKKSSSSLPYTLRIMPYGYDAPVQKVSMIAVLDRNRNGLVDAGDHIGYHSVETNGMPTQFTVYEGDNPGKDIDFTMTVPVPSGIAMSLKGCFTVPSGYNASSPPLYLIVMKVDNPEVLFNDPASAIKYFYRMPAGEFTFNIDLSKTDLLPGDRVIVATLWDRDNAGGFPYPTKGDKLGMIQNNDTYSYFLELRVGVNPVPQEGFEFNTNKIMYDFESSILFALDRGSIESYNAATAQIVILSVHVNGVDINIRRDKIDVSIDMDYVLGSTVIKPPAFDHVTSGPYPTLDESAMRELKLFPALFQEIIVYENSAAPDPLIQGATNQYSGATETAYLFAILDKNGNGQLDTEDVIGYYNREYVVTTGSIVIPGYGSVAVPNGTYYIPAAIETISKGKNTGSSGQPYWIKFDYYDPP